MTDASAIALFEGLEATELDEVRASFRDRAFPKNAVIMLEGEPAEGLYVIQSGMVRVFTLHVDGREKTLAHLGPGETLGEMGLHAGQLRSATAVAVEPTSLLLITNEQFSDLLSRMPRLALKVIGILSDRLRQADRQIHELTFLNARSRVICSLSHLADKQGEPQEGGTAIRTTHAELAKVAGVSRETATKVLSELEGRRLLKTGHGKLWIAGQDALCDQITN